jgi:hypothetical protein
VAEPVLFETKIAVVLLNDLPVWQKTNATAFLVSGFAAADPSLVGEPYVDGSGNRYLPMFRQPVMVYAAEPGEIRRVYERAMAREVEQLAIFTRELFSTPYDAANRAAVAAVPANELDLVGLALRAERKVVDKIVDRLRPHP